MVAQPKKWQFLWEWIQRNNRTLRIALAVLLLVPPIAVIAYRTWQNWYLLEGYIWRWQGEMWALALLGYSAGLFALLWAWDRTVKHLGATSGFLRNSRIYCLTNLSKRIPGPIWYIVGRVHFYRIGGERASVALIATVLENLLLALSGVLVYLLTLPFSGRVGPLHMGIAAGIFLLAVLALYPPFFNRAFNFLLRRVGSDTRVEVSYALLIPLLLIYLAAWIFPGLGLGALTASLYPPPENFWPDILAAWAFSGTVGLIIANLALGVGVREVTLSFLLANSVPQPIAVLAAVLFWVVVTAGELLWAGVFALAGRGAGEFRTEGQTAPGGLQIREVENRNTGPKTTEDEPLVYAVVLSWNFKEYTLRCLESISRINYPNLHILLVDNASSDDTVPAVREMFPQVEIHVNPEDLGFAKGINVGLRIALERGVSYILIVSNDTVLEPDLLRWLMEAMYSDPKVGIVSPLIYYPGCRRVWYAGAYRRRFWPGVTLLGYGRPDHPRYHRRREVDYATGCVLLLRSEMLREIGLFEETFFMYFEDLDLCERARRAGWHILMEPRATMEHIGSISHEGEFSATKWFYIARYSVEFYRRYYRYPHLSLFLYLGWVVVRETLLRGNVRILPPIWRGFRVGWQETYRQKEKPAKQNT